MAYRLVNLSGEFLLLLLGHALGTIPVVVIEPIATTATFAVTLLLENVEHLLGIHASESLVHQAHRLALVRPIGVAWHGYDCLAWVQVFEHEVNHVVTSGVRQAVIFVMQLAPCGEVSIHLVRVLMRHHKRQLGVAQLLHKLAPIAFVSPIGTGGRDVVIHSGTPNHHDATQ